MSRKLYTSKYVKKHNRKNIKNWELNKDLVANSQVYVATFEEMHRHCVEIGDKSMMW
jgi:hypothetical protein